MHEAFINTEIRGIWFTNQGAALMLKAIQAQVAVSRRDINIFVDAPRFFRASRQYGVGYKIPPSYKGIPVGNLVGMIPKGMRIGAGVAIERDIDVVLDASGFTYGDQWGAEKAHGRLGAHVERWKSQGKKIVLLPQAFGPFLDGNLRAVMSSALKYVDLAFARDSRSLEYLRSLSEDHNKVRLAPDFTNLIEGVNLLEDAKLSDRVCVIPNSKMIEAQDMTLGHAYRDAMSFLLSELDRLGERPFILVHEGIKDRNLAEELMSSSGCAIEVIQPNEPLRIKGIIGRSKAVITARFHGLVSALSQAIPALALGWSHKYNELLSDYGVSDCYIKVDSDKAAIRSLLERILETGNRADMISQLAGAAEREKKRSRSMWADVFATIPTT